MFKIETNEQLASFIARASDAEIVCIDTEFMRENTYYPQLCLVQMQVGADSYILDPFCFDNLAPLADFLENEKILKVFHAAAQDLEILYYETGVIPHPIFDTQLAASIVEGTNFPSLANLLKTVLGVKIDKTEGFTDWSRRPLTEKQLRYATEDVLYLQELYETLSQKMFLMGRESWLDDEFRGLCEKERFEVDPHERYIHLKHVNKLKPKQLALAREVAAWREVVAQNKDVPRKHVLSDEQVTEICKRDPKTIDSLFAVRGVQNALSTWEAREVLAALKRGRNCEKKSLPKIDASCKNEKNVDDVVFLMNALVKLRAKENLVSHALIANNQDLTDFARGNREHSKLMSGWRREIVGDELLQLLEGRIGITCENLELKIQQTD